MLLNNITTIKTVNTTIIITRIIYFCLQYVCMLVSFATTTNTITLKEKSKLHCKYICPASYDGITRLHLYIFVGLIMTQGKSKHVTILYKQGYCFYIKYSWVNCFNYYYIIRTKLMFTEPVLTKFIIRISQNMNNITSY